MISRGLGKRFKPAQLPSNKYAFTGRVYLNPVDYQQLLQQAGVAATNQATVGIKNFVLMAEPLESIEQGFFGASSFHREMLEISKLDEAQINVVQTKDLNPLSEINVSVDIKILKKHPDLEFDDDGQILELKEDLIC